MRSLYGHRVTDSVHGTIELTPLEFKIISTPAFQRLRNVKQLGLAHFVYPGADYSRFSHSLGVCHVTGRILRSLQERAGVDISPEENQRYRLAALLHDVGHYPFSHAMERAIRDYFIKKNVLQPKQTGLPFDDTLGGGTEPEPFFLHENLSKEILEKDPQFQEVLEQARIKPRDIYSTILRKSGGRFANLVSSDLDADRMDYLLRTARHTGLPYGGIDLDYLITQLRVDEKDRICLTHKALRTAEHLLLARYFDYQQVNYHKTVAAFELLLEDVLKILVREGYLSCSATDISQMIVDGSWALLDDLNVFQRVRDLYSKTANDPVATQKIWSLLNRYPPKLLADYEFFDSRHGDRKTEFQSHKQHVQTKVRTWAERFKIDEALWYLWDTPGVALTKIGSKAAYLEEPDEEEADKTEQAVRILSRDGKTSKPIVHINHSLMSKLADNVLYALRVYALLTPEQEHLRMEIRDTIRQDVSLPWK